MHHGGGVYGRSGKTSIISSGWQSNEVRSVGAAWETKVGWDNKTPTSVTTARLLNSPAIAVYEELKTFAADPDAYMWRDDKIEEALLQRNDPLVTLGLAQYGASDKVAAVLYQRGST